MPPTTFGMAVDGMGAVGAVEAGIENELTGALTGGIVAIGGGGYIAIWLQFRLGEQAEHLSESA